MLYLGQDVKQSVDARRLHHQLFPMNLNYEDGITTVKINILYQRFKLKSYDFLVDEGRVTGQGTQHDLLKVPGRRLRSAGHLC